MRSALKTTTRMGSVALAALALITSFVVLPLSGCGSGARPGASNSRKQKIGELTFRITWPESTRLIPRAANSIQLRLFKGATEIATPVVIDKPTFAAGQSPVSVVKAFQTLEVSFAPTTFRVEARAFPVAGAGGVVQSSGANTVALTINAPSATVGVTMNSTVQRVEVQPTSGPSLRLNATRTFTATCFDAANNVVLVDPATISWANSNPAAGTLVPGGVTAVFTATGVGQDTEIRAAYTEPDPDVVSPPATVNVASKGLATTGWAKFRGDAQNTGQVNASITGDATNGAQLWQFSTGDSIVFASAAVGALNPATNSWDVYIGSYDNTFYCLDGKTGAERWSFLTNDAIESTPAVSKDGIVYIGSLDGKVYALDTETGTLLWESTLDGPILGALTLSSDGGVYVGTTNGSAGTGQSLFKLNAGNGMTTWQVAVGTRIESSVALSRDESTVYFGGRDGKVYGLQAASGAAAPGWPVTTGATIFVSSPAVDGAGNVYIGSFDGLLYSIAPAGSVNWTFDTGSPIVASPALKTSPTGVASRVYVANYDNNSGLRNSHVFALDGSGAQIWSFPDATSGLNIDLVSSSPAIGRDGTLYFGSTSKAVYAVDSNGGLKWSFDTGDIVESSPGIGPDGTIYVGGWGGKVFALK
jgi:outer membrane protein assembly factor BamB